MNISDLPLGSNPPALEFSHFPSRQYALVWRNWEMIPVKRLAEILQTGETETLDLAKDLGLRIPPEVNPQWLKRGYLSIIRNNWHLLDYDQLLALLGWTPDKMLYTLKEDDFFWHKLGHLKPACGPLLYTPPTTDERAAAKQIRKSIVRNFPNMANEYPDYFGFQKIFEEESTPPAEIKADLRNFDLSMVYSYSAVCGDALLHPELDPYPDGLLAKLAKEGVNAVWIGAILYQLTPLLDKSPEYSRNWEKRIETLNKLIKRAEKYGIGIYLYLNEPRGMLDDFYKYYPEWQGAQQSDRGYSCNCTSHQPVLDYLYNSCEFLFKKAPGLAGTFLITMSENPTSCFSHGRSGKCPRCSQRTNEEVVAEIITSIANGVHVANPDARVIAWNWAWQEEWACKAIDLLPADVEFMSTSEWKLPTNAGNVPGFVIDYSISQVGPSEFAMKQWEHAKKRGLKILAKTQLNNTWENSAVPYIPSVNLVEEHLDNLAEAGVQGIMAGWTLGGWPGGNLELLTHRSNELAEDKFGKAAAPGIERAWKCFSKAFSEFPLNKTSLLYLGPQNYGPMNLLYATPSGYNASMLGFPYDSLDSWRGNHYPEEMFEDQFRKLSENWKEGLDALEEAKNAIPESKLANFGELKTVAEAAYCHFRSTYLQIRFIRLRESGSEDKLKKVLDEEISLAKLLYGICLKDPRIGFEASNNYYYSTNSLVEKVLNCEMLKNCIFYIAN